MWLVQTRLTDSMQTESQTFPGKLPTYRLRKVDRLTRRVPPLAELLKSLFRSKSRILANHTGFYRVTEPGAGALDFAEGKRAVYGRVFRFLRMSDAEVASLEEAARAEALTDAREGEF